MTSPVPDANRVADRNDLVAFVGDLRTSLNRNPTAWENADLDAFLEALQAWVSDSPGVFRNRGEVEPAQPSWSFVAMMLEAAAVYE